MKKDTLPVTEFNQNLAVVVSMSTYELLDLT